MIRVTPLGAGQDVGRSCLLVSIGDKNIMMDCGMHMGYEDSRRFPDFSFISQSPGRFTQLIDCVLITHFHLDHCGALPYFTEMCGYQGPVLMSHPTRSICPILLEDYRKITVDRKGSADQDTFFNSADIRNCMRKVRCIHVGETLHLPGDLHVTAYYAGHVLGAVMFLVQVSSMSVLYTGDYNMTPDRHLGAAHVDRCRPSCLITEATYATTVRDSKKVRERDFLKKVHDCVLDGGKVLIPVFALGRAQELCILIESYWERMGLQVPVYFSAGMTQRANHYYRLYLSWTNDHLKRCAPDRNLFDFSHIQPFDMSMCDQPGPQVLFASPGMLHAGLSLEVFKRWASNPKNMVILPGYCVPGTVGAQVLAGERKVQLEGRSEIEVQLQVKHLSFSAHADAKGIVQLIRQCEPKHVVLVHGEAQKIASLKATLKRELDLVGVHDPANGETVCCAVAEEWHLPIQVPYRDLKRAVSQPNQLSVTPMQSIPFRGELRLHRDSKMGTLACHSQDEEEAKERPNEAAVIRYRAID